MDKPYEQLLNRAKADILIELVWKMNVTGPKRSVTYTLRGLDAYTNKQIAAASGTVVSAGYHPSWGYNVLINHGNGLQTRYAHMIRGSLKVSAGQRVSAGQQLGNIGSTGNVTGPHLHFEVYVNGTRVNPSGYLGR